MTSYENKSQRLGSVRAFNQELNDLKRNAPVPEEFLETLESSRTSTRAQIAILSSIANLSVPSSDLSPRDIAKMMKRFMSHVEYAVEAGSLFSPNGRKQGLIIAQELGSIIDRIENNFGSDLNRYDRLILGELAGLASCLTHREDEWRRISSLGDSHFS
jgi:hypothetical protein